MKISLALFVIATFSTLYYANSFGMLISTRTFSLFSCNNRFRCSVILSCNRLDEGMIDESQNEVNDDTNTNADNSTSMSSPSAKRIRGVGRSAMTISRSSRRSMTSNAQRGPKKTADVENKMRAQHERRDK